MLVARVVPVAPDPIALARALIAAGRQGVALLHAGERGAPLGLGRFSFVAADPDRVSRAIDPLADEPGFVPARGALGGVPRWIGVVPYEGQRARLERARWAGPDTRPRPEALPVEPEWHRYPAVAAIDHHEGRVLVVGEGSRAVARLVEGITAITGRAGRPPEATIEVREEEPAARHAERIAAAQELIRRGDLYQVNLARRLSLRLSAGDPLALYASLARRAPPAFGCCLSLAGGVAVASTSPELLLRAETRAESAAFGALFTAPIKGTRPRGEDAITDRALARELDQDPKEIAELTMIVDVERHDLGRVSEVGSVRVVDGPRVVTHRTVHHRVALLRSIARAGVSRGASREEVLLSMLPSGSVTGAPKVRAMEVIARLEEARRGLYTGGIGFVAQDGSVTLAMAIRTAVLTGNEGEYWAGGGIVADSDPRREVEETRWKALQILGGRGRR